MKLLVVGSMAFDAIEMLFGKTDKTLGGAATYIGLASSDRKSTRLNSSHLLISYAVFCLKKKKSLTV